MPASVTPIPMGHVEIGTSPTLLFTTAASGTYTVTTMRGLRISNRSSTERTVTIWFVPNGDSPGNANLVGGPGLKVPRNGVVNFVDEDVENLAPLTEIWLQADDVGLSARGSGAGVLIT